MSDSEDQHPERDLEDDDELDDEDDDRLFTLAWRAMKERNGLFTGEEDVDDFLGEHGDVAKQARNGSPNLLHAIVDLLKNLDIHKLDDVQPLVKRLVQQYPYLLHTWNDRRQNPVFLAFSNKQPGLVEYIRKCCDKKPSAQRCLEKALEMSCNTEKDKTCLHLALETRSHPGLVLKLAKIANKNTLEAKDSNGKTLLHYAVKYSHCSDKRVEIIKAFIEQDEKVVTEHKKAKSSQPLETFLDLRDKSNSREIQESRGGEERQQEANINYGYRAADKDKNRVAGLPTRSEYEAALRQNDPTKSRVTRDLRAPEREDVVKTRDHNKDRGGTTLGQREKLRRKLREEEERKLREEEANSLENKRKTREIDGRDQSRDRANIGRQVPDHIQTGPAVAVVGRAGSERAPNTPIKRIFFDYKGLPVDILGDLIKKTFIAMQFDEVLKYVRFTNVTVRRRPTPREKAKGAGAELGLRDMEFFFEWLHNEGVRHILKLTVEENGGAVHSDEAIKTALDNVIVEHLDWQKMDSGVAAMQSFVHGANLRDCRCCKTSRPSISFADKRSPQREITGSSVATALAAGLAATIIYCFKTCALADKMARSHKHFQDTLGGVRFNEAHVGKIAQYPAMKTAFSNIGVVNDARFIQVWDLFEPVSQVLDDPNRRHEDRVESFIKLCSNLMDWKNEIRTT
ncbi:hypothetical protein VP1G_04704 [Cytospora mali]|uniref:Uncharacterized protein n=1 Tax=Cytospora mali TaxID=578113 RepID=A0A194V0A8_CYTMA|nr:hypothetical protein VP1G_04704 [Valsa mali var. pyri (nom. inval.)]